MVLLYICSLFVYFFTRINVQCWNIIETPKINGGRHYGLRKEAPYAKANARLILQPLRMKATKCLRLSKETGWPSLTKFSCANLYMKKQKFWLQCLSERFYNPLCLTQDFSPKLAIIQLKLDVWQKQLKEAFKTLKIQSDPILRVL